MKTFICVALLSLANAVVCNPIFTLQGTGHDPDPMKTPPLKLPEGAVPLDHHGTYIDELDGAQVKVHYGVDEEGVHAEFVEPLGGNPVGTHSGEGELKTDKPPPAGENAPSFPTYHYQNNDTVPANISANVESLEISLKSGQVGVEVDDVEDLLSAENAATVPGKRVIKCPYADLLINESIKSVDCNEMEKHLMN